MRKYSPTNYLRMKNYSYKITAVIYVHGKEPEVITSINTNTSIIGAIKDVMKIAERAAVDKVRITRVIDLGV